MSAFSLLVALGGAGSFSKGCLLGYGLGQSNKLGEGGQKGKSCGIHSRHRQGQGRLPRVFC